MKKVIIQNQRTMEIKPCICGSYPEFIQPDYYYTDTWLKCRCGRRTKNTGGFEYASEIPERIARESAVIEWNENKVYMETNI